MLHDLNWLEPGNQFPPACEVERIERYKENIRLFASEQFNGGGNWGDSIYRHVVERIERINHSDDLRVSFPVVLSYHKLMSLKIADLVCGEYPTVSGGSDEQTTRLKTIRDSSNFEEKLYGTVIDLSRLGDAIWRVYIDPRTNEKTFTTWNPGEWFPIVSQDGTNTIEKHVLCWVVNIRPYDEIPEYELHVQIHEEGQYEFRRYRHDTLSGIGSLLESRIERTGLKHNAVLHLRQFATTDTVYGLDDYMAIDSLLAEIMARIGQISNILDKHATPDLTGPASMLTVNQETGERYLMKGSFFATSPGENEPKYLTWDGQLGAAFKEVELLIDQLYVLSEMGASLVGDAEAGGQAISGTAMRFKMVGPIAKSRRIANALTRPVRLLLEMLSGTALEDISVFWYDGLPDDPRENIENAKLASGEEKLMPLKDAIQEYFARSPKEAQRWIDDLDEQILREARRAITLYASAGPSPVQPSARSAAQAAATSPNHPGPQDGTGVNTQRNGSTTGFQAPRGLTNGN